MGADTVVLAGNRNQPCIAEAHPSSARTATISIHRRPDFPIFVATVLAAVLFTAGRKPLLSTARYNPAQVRQNGKRQASLGRTRSIGGR
nr:hypothetical protein [Methylobacterium radiotolerans JCM 2831]